MRSPDLSLEVQEVAYHRNGVCGNGFHAVKFNEWPDAGDTIDDEPLPRKMLGIVFDEPGSCAVVQLNQAGEFTVKFGVNSWRGDRYEAQLRKAIETMPSSGSIRLGPFALPTA